MNTNTLEARIYSAFPIIKIETDEEPVLQSIRRIAERTGKSMITWSIASGLKVLEKDRNGLAPINTWTIDGLQGRQDPHTETEAKFDPEEMLEHLGEGITNTIIVLLDFHPYFQKPRVTRLLKEAAFDAEKKHNKIILMSNSISVPEEISRLTQSYRVQMPSLQKITQLVEQEIALFKIKRKEQTLEIDETAKSLLINNLVGVNSTDAQRLIRNAIYIDNALTESDVPEIKKAKYELISHSGALTYEYDTRSFENIGGFVNLKSWVEKRQHAILAESDNPQLTTDRPKGILLLGVQGCGKSLAARSLSGQLGIPLIRLDFGSLFNKYIGESEKNIRKALHSAEVMSPCVLWIDELEKSITSGDGGDNSGASSRILSYLLNWMQENKSGTFVVATANDITALPPELIRKGRLDEIFFVDLPNSKVRMDIVRSVLSKRGLDVNEFDIVKIAVASHGFSGAEIEQAVVSSLYHTSHLQAPLCTDSILHEMQQTQPLSVVRSESIAELRHWAANRTVSVDEPFEAYENIHNNAA